MSARAPAKSPSTPYYAVIFTSQRNPENRGYDAVAQQMVELAARQSGFLGLESARDPNGFGITVSYWASEDAIASWKANTEHVAAQKLGRGVWYAHYVVRVAKVERQYGKPPTG